jgi:hypothetical protein
LVDSHGNSHVGLKKTYLAVFQNLVPLVNIKIAGKWMFIPLKMVLIGIDPYPFELSPVNRHEIPHGVLTWACGTVTCTVAQAWPLTAKAFGQ